jgi:hypothetical protein
MKIPDRNIINIHTKTGSNKFPSGFEEGKIYPAKIIERSGKFSGIIEISGKRLSAEFTQGLPRENILNLKAEISANGRITFKIVENLNQESLKNTVAPFTVLSAGELEGKLFDISRLLSKNINSLFELNAHLIGNGIFNKKNRIKNLAEKLIHKGISRESVQNLITVISGTNALKPYLSILSLISGKTGRSSSKHEQVEKIKSEIDSIITQINEKFENPDEIINEILDILQQETCSDPDKKYSYSLFIDNNDNLKDYEYIQNGKNMIISADFSLLGKITIIIHDSGNILHISIIAETSDAENLIMDDIKSLKNSLAHKGIKCGIITAISKNVLDKLNEINIIHQSHRALDIKI